MPTFYEGEPLAVFSFTISEQDYEEAYYLQQNFRSAMHRKETKVAICLTAALLFAALIPYFYRKFGSFWIPAIGIILSIWIGIFFLILQPKAFRRMGSEIYQSNRLLQLVNTVSVYRDSLIYENENEKFSQYWTDFEQCLETEIMFFFVGGERNLLILKKDGLSLEDQKRLSEHFQSIFVSKYRQAKH